MAAVIVVEVVEVAVRELVGRAAGREAAMTMAKARAPVGTVAVIEAAVREAAARAGGQRR